MTTHALPPGATRGFLSFLLGSRTSDARVGSVGSLLAFDSQYGADACAHVLGAEDKADLDVGVELLASNDELWREERRARREIRDIAKVLDQVEEDCEAMVAVGGQGVADKFRGAVRLLRSTVHVAVALDEWMRGDAEPPLFSAERHASDRIVSDFLYDPELPLAARKVMLEILKACVSAAVLSHAVTANHALERWVALALADSFEDGMRTLNRGLQSFGSTISKLMEAGKADHHFYAVVADWQETALHSDEGVFFPLGDPRRSSVN